MSDYLNTWTRKGFLVVFKVWKWIIITSQILAVRSVNVLLPVIEKTTSRKNITTRIKPRRRWDLQVSFMLSFSLPKSFVYSFWRTVCLLSVVVEGPNDIIYTIVPSTFWAEAILKPYNNGELLELAKEKQQKLLAKDVLSIGPLFMLRVSHLLSCLLR